MQHRRTAGRRARDQSGATLAAQASPWRGPPSAPDVEHGLGAARVEATGPDGVAPCPATRRTVHATLWMVSSRARGGLADRQQVAQVGPRPAGADRAGAGRVERPGRRARRPALRRLQPARRR